jgi:hypothetical protein
MQPGDNGERNLCMDLLQPFDEIVSRNTGKAKVNEYEIGLMFLQPLQTNIGRRRGHYFMAFTRQTPLHELQKNFVVVDDQQLH